MFDYLAFILRGEPLHNGHCQIIDTALKESKTVVLLLGSSNATISPRNPFTYEQRKKMILETYAKHLDRIVVAPLPDFPYDEQGWVANVQKTVNNIVKGTGWSDKGFNPVIGLIGYSKDSSSYYLKKFPMWKAVNVPAQHSTLNSTEIRDAYLVPFFRIPDTIHCPVPVINFMKDFAHTPDFKWLVKEAEFYRNYRESIKKAGFPYPFQILCADAVVVQSGHILLVERGKRPGLGNLALPGGHVETDESFRECAVRELKEETKISDTRGEIPPAVLESYITKSELIDNPTRSLRGRVVTTAFFFELPDKTKLYDVRGNDDAKYAKWYKLGDLDPTMFFEDHYHIITKFVKL